MDQDQILFQISETIFLARAQMFLGTVLVVLSQTDPNLFSGLAGKWFPIFLIGHGVVVEYARKRRDPELKNRS